MMLLNISMHDHSITGAGNACFVVMNNCTVTGAKEGMKTRREEEDPEMS